jgi:hypothetical protein
MEFLECVRESGVRRLLNFDNGKRKHNHVEREHGYPVVCLSRVLILCRDCFVPRNDVMTLYFKQKSAKAQLFRPGQRRAGAMVR